MVSLLANAQLAPSVSSSSMNANAVSSAKHFPAHAAAMDATPWWINASAARSALSELMMQFANKPQQHYLCCGSGASRAMMCGE